MRNLRLIDCDVTKDLAEICDAVHLSIDSDVGTVYVATEAKLLALNPSAKEIQGCLSLETNEAGCPEVRPVGLQYLADQQAVCVATQDGRICLWQIDSPELECVGDVDQGLTSMAWSPDLELVLITTGNDTMIMMTREFDPLTEVPIFTADSEENPVSVGWGKKETQFHGSAGKQAAKTQAVLVKPVGSHDSKQPLVRWRGDGQFFVVSAIDPHTGGRFLYVWSRECVLQSCSEPVDGLQAALSWKPSGSLIASVQKVEHLNRQDVVFYEKNGLRHGEFTIPDSHREDMMVKSVLWNQDSTILAVWIDFVDESGKQAVSSSVQLWTTGNYHWYLKQSLAFPRGVQAVAWDPEASHRLSVATRDGDHLAYTWAWHTCSTPGHLDTDWASVAVIDAGEVKLSPMRSMVVPPPMSAFSLSHPSAVNALAPLCTPQGSNNMAVLLADGTVTLWRYQGNSPTQLDGVKLDAAGGNGFGHKCVLPTSRETLELDRSLLGKYPLAVNNFVWLAEGKFVFTTVDETGSHCLLHIGEQEAKDNVIKASTSLPMPTQAIGIAVNGCTGTLVVQLKSGGLLKLGQDPPSLRPWQSSSGASVKFPYPCTQMAVTMFANEEVVLGLTERFRFYVNDIEVASNCTSFGVHNDFILLTTLSHTARCIDKKTKLAELPKLSEGKAHPFDESIRRVERGSRIVAVVSNDTKVVLQMPRGNLETIHPRALVLDTLKHLLDSDKVSEAFLVMRKHRINMNLLHDHNPAHFMENVEQVVTQIKSVNHLNLFLTDLREEDVTCTMYTASYGRDKEAGSHSQASSGSKVDTVCDAFIRVFYKLGQNRYLLSILTAHVRKTEPELEKALLLVWSLHGQKANGCGEGVTAEEALKYLLFLVDVSTLYDVALGTYNFDLVIMVAEKSQKDPKEYIPFLNELRRLDETYRRYTIDKHLKKFSKALESIAKCGSEHFEECVALACEHKLYRKSLQMFKPDTTQYKRLASLYAAYLRTKNRHDEAGIMFAKAEDWTQALEAFRAAHDWRQVFCMAARLGYQTNQLSELASKVAGELKGRQRHEEAARVLEEYAQDPEEAVVALIEGSHWDEALRIMHKHQRLDLIQTHLLEAIEESFDQHKEVIASQRELFNRYRSRLTEVRLQKERAKVMIDGGTDYNDAEADLFSDTSSMTGGSVASLRSFNSSRSTVLTKATGSSRTRRKAENKKWSLKEGSLYEEYALVDALGTIVKSVDGSKESVSGLMKCLIQFHNDSKAQSLQEDLASFLTDIQGSMADIWCYTQHTSGIGTLALGPGSTASAIAQAVQRGQRPSAEQEPIDTALLAPPTLNKDLRWKLHMSGDQDR